MNNDIKKNIFGDFWDKIIEEKKELEKSITLFDKEMNDYYYEDFLNALNERNNNFNRLLNIYQIMLKVEDLRMKEEKK